MSGDNTNSVLVTNNKKKRSRSLLSQFHAKFSRRSASRHQIEVANESPEKVRLSLNTETEKRQSKRSRKTTSIPNSFSHRLSLFKQFKSHIIGNRTYRRTTPSTSNDDDDDDNNHVDSFSSKSTVFNMKPQVASVDEGHHHNGVETISNGSPPPSSNMLVNKNIDGATAVIATPDDSSNAPGDSQGQVATATTTSTSKVTVETHASGSGFSKFKDGIPFNKIKDGIPLNKIKDGMQINKLKDSISQRATNVMSKTASLTTMFDKQEAAAEPDEVYWTEIRIERGKELAAKDIDGTSDPYVRVLYGTEEKYVTNTIESTLNPVWNETFTFFTHDLNIPIYFQIFDRDRIGRDEEMGSVKLDLWKLPFERLYCATLDLQDEKRNDGRTGMLKVAITITPKSVEFRDEVMKTLAKQAAQQKTFFGKQKNAGIILTRRTIDVFIIEGRKIVSNDVHKKCSPFIKLKFGQNKKYKTKIAKNTSTPIWHQSFMYDTTQSEIPPLELTVCDDASSGDFIGRGVCNITHLEEERTHKIAVDLEDGAGTIDIFVTVTGTTPLQEATNDGDCSANYPLDHIPSKLTEEDYKHYTLLGTLKAMDPVTDIGKLEIKIYQARELSAKDLGGKSDPFCIVELDSTRLRTHTIYKTLDPCWNRSFIVPSQDIHSVVQISVYDEDTSTNNEFIGKVSIPLLAIKNGVKKWYQLKDQKSLLPVKGAIEIEATYVYTNLKAVIRTINPRQAAYYAVDEKFSIGAIKTHIARVTNMLSGIANVGKFITYCFGWDNPFLSFFTFMSVLVIVWNFELYMLPCTLLLVFARNAIREYRRGRLGVPYGTTLIEETVDAVGKPQTVIPDEDVLEVEATTKEEKKSFLGMIQGIQDTVMEIQGYIDEAASSFERIKNLMNYSVPWLSVLLIVLLHLVAVALYYVPLRALILAFVINKFTKRFRKPKGFIDNNELADFMSRLPSDPELVQFKELKINPDTIAPRKHKK